MLFSGTAHAQTFVPNKLVFSLTALSSVLQKNIPVLESGDIVDLKATLDISDLPQDKTMVEYGVFKQITNGNTTEYEPIEVLQTDKVYVKSGEKTLKVNVPKVFEANGTSTYVFYARTYVTDDVDKENMVISKNNFFIHGNNSPITKVKYVNLYHSNGTRYSIGSGPTIYDLSKTTYKGVASSTSIEVTFESNIDTVVTPNINFSKLRSDVKIPDLKPEDIKIRKGETTVTIPLPTFDYAPGVYLGNLKLDNSNIPTISFKYIVGGDMVTFGEPVYVLGSENQVLNFEIYGTPIDLNLDEKLNNLSTSTIVDQTSNSGMIYGTTFMLLDKNNKSLYTVSKDIDFSTSTYSLVIPKDIKNITGVSIKTMNKNGVVLFEGTKQLNIPENKSNTLMLVSLGLLFILAISSVFLFKHKYIKLLAAIIALAILFLGINIATASVVWPVGVWPVDAKYKVYEALNSDEGSYRSGTIGYLGSLVRFNTNVPTEQYSPDEDLVFTYQASYTYCTNDPNNGRIQIGLTTKSENYMKNVQTWVPNNGPFSHGKWVTTQVVAQKDIMSVPGTVYNYGLSYAGSNTKSASYEGHRMTFTSKWITTNIGKPTVGSNLLIFYSVVGGGKGGYTTYKIPLNIKQILVPNATSTIPTDIDIPKVTISVDDINSTGATVKWTYTAPKPQANYQVQVSDTEDFSGKTINNVGSNDGITRKNDSGAQKIFSLLKRAVAAADISSIRDSIIDGLLPSTKYWAKVRAGNGTEWSEWASVPFTTASSTSGAVNGCDTNIISDGVGLYSTSTNLCKTGHALVDKSFNLNSNSAQTWSWKCTQNSTPSNASNCSARCQSNLYDSSTNKCLTSGSNGDMCSNIEGIQLANDSIYKTTNCILPTLTATVKLNSPFADENTSKCSLSWSATSNVDTKLENTTCKLDGKNVNPIQINQQVLVGRHTLVWQTNISDGAASTISSLPVTKSFNCQRVPIQSEN